MSQVQWCWGEQYVHVGSTQTAEIQLKILSPRTSWLSIILPKIVVKFTESLFDESLYPMKKRNGKTNKKTYYVQIQRLLNGLSYIFFC